MNCPICNKPIDKSDHPNAMVVHMACAKKATKQVRMERVENCLRIGDIKNVSPEALAEYLNK